MQVFSYLKQFVSLPRSLLMFKILITCLQKDYPDKWPTLVPSLTSVLTSDRMDLILLVLQTMTELFRKFRHESKSQELWVELKTVLLTVYFVKEKPYTCVLGTRAIDQYICQLD